ncbi:hypothetical protein OESDEN_19667, partial [Oesophagostomum dentatum]
IWIFPEGTRNHGDGFLRFKKGAFNIAIRGGFPIVPIVLSSYRPFYSKAQKYFKTDGEVIAKVLKPISTKGGSAIFIDRYHRDKAMEQIDYCVEQMKKKNMKVGGFPIVPIVLSSYRPFYSKAQKYFKTDGEVIAKVLKPISTKGLTVEDVPELSENIRNQMLEVHRDISEEAAEKMKRKRQSAM